MTSGSLSADLSAVLSSGSISELNGLRSADPVDDRDAAEALLLVGAVHFGQMGMTSPAVRLVRHPALAEISWRLEERFLAKLEHLDATHGPVLSRNLHSASAALRAVAHVDQIPAIYRWVAEQATLDQLVEFLSYEGGPDGGFDDLVAICQVGLDGEPKMELARNYWDEMGNGLPDRVHTELHRKARPYTAPDGGSSDLAAVGGS